MRLPKVGYVIHNPVRDKYSSGGNFPHWADRGKVWYTKAALSNHLSQLANKAFYSTEECYVLEYEIKTVVQTRQTVAMYQAEAKMRRDARNKTQVERNYAELMRRHRSERASLAAYDPEVELRKRQEREIADFKKRTGYPE